MQDLALAVALAIYNVGSLVPETRQLQLPYVAFLLVALQALPQIIRHQIFDLARGKGVEVQHSIDR